MAELLPVRLHMLLARPILQTFTRCAPNVFVGADNGEGVLVLLLPNEVSGWAIDNGVLQTFTMAYTLRAAVTLVCTDGRGDGVVVGRGTRSSTASV